jgi:hypothetical protein
MNFVEIETRDAYSKGEIVKFYEDKKTLKINDYYSSSAGNLQFTFDHIFTE